MLDYSMRISRVLVGAKLKNVVIQRECSNILYNNRIKALFHSHVLYDRNIPSYHTMVNRNEKFNVLVNKHVHSHRIFRPALICTVDKYAQ